MAFVRARRGKNGAIHYSLLQSYRDGGKYPRHRTLKSWTVGPVGQGAAFGTKLIESPLLVAPALPFMIAHDLITGNRVAALKEHLANTPPPQTEPPNYHIIRANISFPASPHPVVPIEKSQNALHIEPSKAQEPMRDECGSRFSQVDKEIEAREQAFEKSNDEYVETQNAIDAAKDASQDGKGESDTDGGQDGEAEGEG
jgi:hypothetical protein